jgi:tetratricopeptide (TPR) repeat protein
VAAVAWDPRAPAADPKRALGLLVAVAALAVVLTRRGEGKGGGGPRAVMAFVAFVAWSGVTLAWGVPSGARDLGTWVAAAGVAVVAGRRLVAERAALLAGSGAPGIAVAERLAGARGIFVHGGQGNANWLGLLMAITLPLTVGLALNRARNQRKGAKTQRRKDSFPIAFAPLRLCAFALPSLLALQLAGLVLSHSRVAWAASALSLAALVLTAAPARWRAVAAAGLVALAAVPLVLAERDASPARVAEGEDVPVPIAWRGRVWIWRASADAAVASLPAGAGLGGFGHAYLDAQGKRLAAMEPNVASRSFLNATTAHSDWIEVLVDSGPPALALLAFAVAWGALGAVRRGWPAGAAALGAFAICAAGDSPLRQPGVAMVLGLVLAGCEEEVGWARLVRPARVALLGAAALLLAASVSGWMAARRLTAAREALPDARRALLASAARLDPGDGEVALEQGLLELESGDPEAALAALQRSRPLLANVGTDVAIGNAEMRLGRPGAALAAYEAALLLHPGSFRAHANAAEPLMALGRLDEAERHLAVAARLWPGNPHLAEMAEQLRRARIEKATGPADP